MARPAISAVMPTLSSSPSSILAGLLDELLAVGPALVDHRLDLGVLARVERREGEVLELPLERVDAQAVRERRVDLERLLRLLDLLLLGRDASVRMLCSRSASLIRMTRMSCAIDRIILR